MLLQDELKPHFDAIIEALSRKGDMPRALEAERAVVGLYKHVVRVDAREKYLSETLLWKPGTVLIYLEGNPHYPIRKRVLRVTKDRIFTDWHEQKRLERPFDHLGWQVDGVRDHQSALDRMDLRELEMVLATAA